MTTVETVARAMASAYKMGFLKGEGVETEQTIPIIEKYVEKHATEWEPAARAFLSMITTCNE